MWSCCRLVRGVRPCTFLKHYLLIIIIYDIIFDRISYYLYDLVV